MDSKLKSAYEMIATGHKLLAEYYSAQIESSSPVATKISSPKMKVVKDPNAPKKPASSFLIFSSEMRPIIKEKNPDMTHLDITKELGVLWKTADQKKYEEMAKARVNEYHTRLENYKKEKDSKSEDQSPIESPIKRSADAVDSPKKKVKAKHEKVETLSTNAPVDKVVEQVTTSESKKEEEKPTTTEESKSESPKKKKKHSESLDPDAIEKKKLKKKKKEEAALTE